MARRPANRQKTAQVYIDWIRKALDEGRHNQRAIARHMGWAPSAVTRILNGTRRIKAEEIHPLATLLGPPPGVSGVQIASLPTFSEVHVIGRISMTEWSTEAPSPSGPKMIVGTTHRFPASEQACFEVERNVRDKMPDIGTHVFSVAASIHRPRPMPGDRFVVRRQQDAAFSPTGKLLNDHLFRAELRGSGIVLIGVDGSEMQEPWPDDMRWIVATHTEFS